MLGTDDLLACRRLVFIDHFALVIDDLQNGDGRDLLAAVGEHGIGASHLQQADIAAAQRQGQTVIGPGEAW